MHASAPDRTRPAAVERRAAAHDGAARRGGASQDAPALFDMHCHLDFSDAGADVAQSLRGSLAAFSATVDPRDFERASDRFAHCAHVRTGLGLHPWQAACADFAEQMQRFIRHAPSCAFIGEVGLDFSPKRAETRAAQRAAFERVVETCMAPPAAGALAGDAFSCGIVSIHAVHAADEVVDAFERAGACGEHARAHGAFASGRALVIHSFNGTSDQLQRAIKAGFFFSVGPRMLASKRGRAYARAIPADRIMLETDMPSCVGVPFSADAWRAALEEALEAVRDARGQSSETMRALMGETSARILGL